MESAKQKRPKSKTKSAPDGEVPIALTIDELFAEENKDLEKSINEKGLYSFYFHFNLIQNKKLLMSRCKIY